MKGDFTRNTFKSDKHYSGVRSQQGRVQVDADWNEAVDILAHWDRTTRRDVIGPCGGPQGQDGFLIKVVGEELHIGEGRYYVDGLLVENDATVAITAQPDLPDLPDNTLSDVLVPAGEVLERGKYLAYLDVWERHITALEDPSIREVALGGPDTATRTKAVWQVKLLKVPEGFEEEATLDCASKLPPWVEVTAPSSGQLTAQADPGDEDTGPCEVPAQAGYRGLENQLYRVEVHRVLSDKKITLKWSRENGSVVFGWTDQDNLMPNKLTLSSPGRDEVLGLATDDWVELTDDKHELRGEPGLLVKVVSMEGNVLTIDPGSATVKISEFPVNPKVRRWDMPRDVGEIFVDLDDDKSIPLENGIEVKLKLGTYRTGDYWLIPARTASRDIEWPRDDAKKPLPQLPYGILHHYCRLALLSFSDTEGEPPWEVLNDCRRLFPPLTEMIRFFHVAGDGQEAMPGQPLPRPLQVGVVNGLQPLAEARVQFQVVVGNGRLLAAGESDCADFTAGGAKELVTETGLDGLAGCCWRPDAVMLSQQVEARLLEIDGKPLVDDDGNPLLPPIRFNANLSKASQVAYDPRNCPDLKAAETVQQAIDLLCQRPQGGGCCVTVGRDGEYERLDQAIHALLEAGQRDICLCLLAGNHSLPGLEFDFPLDKSEFHLKITGCGLGSRVFLDRPLRFRGLREFILQNLALEPHFLAQGDLGAIALDHCAEVTLTSCHLSGFTDGDENNAKGLLLSIADADRVHLRDNVIEAALVNSFNVMREMFKRAKVDFLEALFSLPQQGIFSFEKFRLNALESAKELAKLNIGPRKKIQENLQKMLSDNQVLAELSLGERFVLAKFIEALIPQKPQIKDLLNALIDMRRTAIKSRPGGALMLTSELRSEPSGSVELASLDEDDYITLESNEVIGILSLYGMPAPADSITEIISGLITPLRSRIKEGQITFSGLLGTLQVRGNQLLQITVSQNIIGELQQLAAGSKAIMHNLFGRCLLTDNVIESATSVLVTQHLAMTANVFTMVAFSNIFEIVGTDSFEQFQAPVAIVVGDSSIYVGNHGTRQNPVLSNVTRIIAQAANLQINIA